MSLYATLLPGGPLGALGNNRPARFNALLASFSPSALFAAGEQGLWLDPSDLSTLFQDDGGTVPVTADGDPVGLILDKSGNGNHASQATLASRPTYRTDGTLHWLEFDGVDDGLVTTAVLPINTTDEVTLCIGQKHLVNSPTGYIVELSPNRQTNTNAFSMLSPATVANRPYNFVIRGSISTENSVGTTSVAYNAPHTGVLTGVGKISPSNSILRINGIQVAAGTTATGTGNWGSYQLYIGRRSGTTITWMGLLYGLVVRNVLTADSALSSAEAFMAAKTGISW